MEDNRQKLLLIGPRGVFGYEGGIEKFADEFIPRASRYVDITLLTLHELQGTRLDNLRIIKMPSSGFLQTDKIWLLLYAPFLYICYHFDHVLICGTNLSFLIPVFKLIFWRRSKIHLRSGSVDHQLKKWPLLMRFFMKQTEKLCRFADTCLAVSASVQKHLESLSIRTHLTKNGIHQNKASSQKRQKTIMAVGRITGQKNYALLIESAARLGEKNPKIKIFGAPDMSDEKTRLTHLLKDKKDSSVSFCGSAARNTILKELETVGLYINCSVHEGMSNAALEAIETGTPLILSDIPANRDLALLEHHYFPLDDPDFLARKIIDALENPSRYTADPSLFDSWDACIKNILRLTGIAT